MRLMVPGTTKIQLALKVWPVIGQTFSVDLLLSRVRPLGPADDLVGGRSA